MTVIPAEQVMGATIISAVVTAIVTVFGLYLLFITRKKKGPFLLNAISSSDGMPSLANLQLFMWSIVIGFAFLQSI